MISKVTAFVMNLLQFYWTMEHATIVNIQILALDLKAQQNKIAVNVYQTIYSVLLWMKNTEFVVVEHLCS